MKVELQNAKVELQVGEGTAILYVNGHPLPVPRSVGISLIFGDEDSVKRPTIPVPAPQPKPGVAKVGRRSGPQSAAARKRLSESLKAYHAKKRKQKGTPIKKGHLNGSSLHVN